MPLPNDPAVEAIAERLRATVARQPARSVAELAEVLALDGDQLRRLIEDPPHRIDVTFLIDTVTAVVHSFAVDPQWLLTGRYDTSVHRQALLLAEDRSFKGLHILRDFIGEQYRRLRDSTLALIRLPAWHEPTTIER